MLHHLSPKVSVIVPVYNTELYVERAIVSLMEQTLDDVQFIIIDDGSKDNSLNIIKHVIARYPAREGQVTLISRENRGVAATRAQGMELATGDYVIHLDSDDWAELNWLEAMYTKAIEENADVVVCDYNEIFLKKSTARTQVVPSTKLDCIANLLNGHISNANWNKLIKKEIFSMNNIFFTSDIKMGEDFLVTLEVFIGAEKIGYIDKKLYNYNRCNENSLTLQFDDKALSDLIFITDKMNYLLIKNNISHIKLITNAINLFKLNVRNMYVLQSLGRQKLKEYALKIYPETNLLIEHGLGANFLKVTYFLSKYRLTSLFFLIDILIVANKMMWRFNLKS